MNFVLSEVEARVLGCLIEKEITTPEYYPLSLNALVNACNQKSNRHPVMNLDEDAVKAALRTLSDQMLARSAGVESRVAKYEHRLADAFNFTRPDTAIVCELLLRGPQTPGELRSRAERLHPFEDLSVVHSTLKHLMEREPPVVALLPRQPGTKEARYAHLFSGELESQRTEATRQAQPSSVSAEPVAGVEVSNRMTQLEAEVSSLRMEVEELKRELAEFRKQFD